jgi:hypothetical protein
MKPNTLPSDRQQTSRSSDSSRRVAVLRPRDAHDRAGDRLVNFTLVDGGLEDRARSDQTTIFVPKISLTAPRGVDQRRSSVAGCIGRQHVLTASTA